MADEGVTEIQIEGKSYPLDDFELGELEWLEEEMDCTLDEIPLSSMKAAVRFLYIIKRRDDPSYTLDDARKTKIAVFAGPDEEAAKPAARKRPTRAAPKASG